LVSTVSEGTKDFLLAQAPGHDPVFAVWSISDNAEPRMVTKHDFLVNEIGGQATPDLVADFDPYVVGSWWLSTKESLAYFANDSMYVFDATKGTIRIAFHPTFEGVEVRIGTGGRWALFLRGGARVFVFQE
jgi:hypothetical protein